MIRIINDPTALLFEVIEELYPEVEAELQYKPSLDPEKGECGLTHFLDDDPIPKIDISAQLPFFAILEVISHEVAHVVAGIESEHGEKWDEVSRAIQNRYNEKIAERAAAHGGTIIESDGSPMEDTDQL